jgi:negative regulator of flagellin synthesis FlgM
MRIEAYNQIQQMYQTKKPNKAQKAVGSASSDQLQISNLGKEIQLAKTAVAASPDIREDLTAGIKEQVKNGTYDVKPESFAEKLLGAYQKRL